MLVTISTENVFLLSFVILVSVKSSIRLILILELSFYLLNTLILNTLITTTIIRIHLPIIITASDKKQSFIRW